MEKSTSDQNLLFTKILLLLNLGALNALEKNILTVDEAEFLLYSPYMMELLKENNFPELLVNIIHKGTELEDLIDFNLNAPKQIQEMLKECENLLATLPALPQGLERWFTDASFKNQRV